ncbi:amidohydrolase [bacterium]|nr:amidohydrolase [bacterium]
MHGMTKSRGLCPTFIVLAVLLLNAAVSGLRAAELDLPYLLDFYRTRHAAPELSYFEENTSAALAAELEKLGYEVTRKVGKYPDPERTGWGVVAVLKNGKGPTLMLRTDMDALPVEEKTGAPFASKVRAVDITGQEVPVMHACGHDFHMTVMLGAASRLAAQRNKWKGTLIIIGQPAEERGSGAAAMLADSLYTRWPRPDFALAEHDDPSVDAGSIGWCPGYAMANIDMVDITVHGIGSHGAMPDKGRDPIVLSAQLINAFQTIVSREIEPVEPAVVTVGSIHGGTKHNIIPDEVKLQLTTRSFSDQVRRQILDSIKRICANTARAYGLPEDKLPEIKLADGYTPALYNDPALAECTVKAMGAALGQDKMVRIKPTMGGEDFSEYGRTAEKVPVFMFRVGTGKPGVPQEQRPGLHSPLMLPEYETAIPAGVTAMTAAALEILKK